MKSCVQIAHYLIYGAIYTGWYILYNFLKNISEYLPLKN